MSRSFYLNLRPVSTTKKLSERVREALDHPSREGRNLSRQEANILFKDTDPPREGRNPPQGRLSGFPPSIASNVLTNVALVPLAQPTRFQWR